MEKLMDAVRYYQEKTSDRVTFEYILIDGINDSDDNARELAERLKGMMAHVNVIPVNPVEECGFARPSEARIRRFMAVLEEKGVNVTRRREMGKNIDAACGQLRARAGKKLDH